MVHYVRPMPRKIEISHRTIIFTVSFLLFLWFLYAIRDVLLLLFLSLLVMTVFHPLVKILGGLKIPRGLAIAVSYLLAFILLGVIIAGIVPPLVSETSSLVAGLPEYLEKLQVTPAISDRVATEILTKLGGLPGQLLKVGVGLFSNIFAIIAVLITAFYMLLMRERLDEQLGTFFGDDRKKDFGKLIDELEKRLGGWARGQLILMVIMGFANFLGLSLLGIPYALPLALLAGVLEIVPYLGPMIAAVPAAIIGFGISAPVGLGVIAMVLVIQQIENYFLVPKIFQKSVGLSPILTLLALAIGGRLAGVPGVLISVPVVITLQVFAERYLLPKE